MRKNGLPRQEERHWPPNVNLSRFALRALWLRTAAPFTPGSCHPNTMGLYSERFHGLLTLFAEFYFNFPLRYLFTIGSVEIFSLRSSLRPALRCTVKQRDSQGEALPTNSHALTGLTPSLERFPAD